MKLSSIITTGAGVLLLAAATCAQAGEANRRTLKFEDPNTPGRVVIQIGVGDVHVAGADVAEVTVESDSVEPAPGASEPRADGLRRLDSGGGSNAISSSGNVITITASSMFGFHGGNGGSSNIALTVPASTTVVVERSGPGDTKVEQLSGDVEIHAVTGDIELAELSGGAAVETVNGDVRAIFAKLAPERPVSISAVRGDVDLHVPAASGADVRFRTLRGEVLTDFGDELQTRTEDEAIEGPQGGDDAARKQAERDRREAEKAARRAEEDARRAHADATRAAGQHGGHVFIPPIPPIPPMPPMAGGRVVAGTLNGGGADISVTTLNGDITFRKVK